ncbi:hypothetical protein L2K70_16370 [Nocardioides KLBMP 9356]|uniref:Lipoprotein n=1 Tax=Nocardioides potassii TaxID=2911371 RepID=A0ABS9HGE9_9ACTN|nr:hypothetical protein [Nocardioides potassii]MCF6379188.1 hypothetical protein [Nocardioides potassii]
MRTTLLLVALAVALSACSSGGGSGGSGETPDAVAKTTTDHAEAAVPVAVRALEGDKVKAFGQWQSCMALSWRYEVFASMTAPEGDTATQLAAVKDALVEDGWTDDTQVDDHVTLTRDDTTVDVTPSPARGPGTWVVKVQSGCADYDGDDKDVVEHDEARPIEGLTS